MSNPPTQQLIDASVLAKEIQARLNQHRGESPFLQINVEHVWLDDGHWRATVKPAKNEVDAGRYAEVLATVEEELADTFGVNVLLIAASDQK